MLVTAESHLSMQTFPETFQGDIGDASPDFKVGMQATFVQTRPLFHSGIYINMECAPYPTHFKAESIGQFKPNVTEILQESAPWQGHTHLLLLL